MTIPIHAQHANPQALATSQHSARHALHLSPALAAVYWNYFAGATDEFKARYGYKEGGIGYPGTDTLSTIGYDYPNGAFIVPAGSLGFR